MTDTSDPLQKLGDIAATAGIRRIHVLAWRDLDDVEAGGSEVHAAEVARLWSEAGLEVVMRTSYAQGHPPRATRDGYQVIRKAGRYLVFPRAAASEALHRYGRRDALVEIWNGMPFFSPLWATGPRVVFLHHVHAEMWKMVLPPNLARLGDTLERRWPQDLPPLPDDHAVAVVQAGDARRRLPSRPHRRGPAGGGRPLHPRWRGGPRCRWWSASAGSCR
ncbi:MAG: hypothetical protein R2746_08915 [Acidimicrobiales bacterium]